LRLTIGAGGGGGGATTVTADDTVTLPPAPVQVNAKLVAAVNGAEDTEPLTFFTPLQPPDAAHELALVLLQDSCVVAPLATLDGFAVRLAVGAGMTVTDLLSFAEPPVPWQVSVNVVGAVIGAEDAEPLTFFAPLQPPDAAQELALVLLQDSCVVEPLATLDGFAFRLTVGAGTTVTDLLSLAVPLAPVQVRVKVALADRLALTALPLVA